MTEEQKNWTRTNIRQIESQIEAYWPLTDEQWDRVRETLQKVYERSKCNREVRTMLFDAMLKYNQREIQERKMRI